MPTDPRIRLTALPLLALGACFDPTVDLGDGDGSATDASSTGTSLPDPTGSTTDTDTDSAEGNADSTGATDAPPVISAFTLNGSTVPQEQQTAGMLAFDVDATDDVGIDRIEIYDGEELVATVTEAPYVTEILLTSADNGSHLYSAIAYDNAGQTDESDAVPMSVNVVGGAILELREDIADAYMPAGVGYPRAVLGDNDNVFVSLTTPPDALERSHVQALGYSSTLGLLWDSTLNPFGTSVFAMAHPIVTDGGELIVGAIYDSSMGNDDTVGLYRANIGTGDPLSPALFGMTDGNFAFSVAAELFSGDIVLSPAPNVLEARSPDFGSISWTEEQFPALPSNDGHFAMIGVDIDGAGSLLLTFIAPEPICGQDEPACIRKLSPDGTTLWTRPASTMGSVSFMPARFDRAGRAITVWANGAEGVLTNIYDSEGALVESFQVLAGDRLHAQDLAMDSQGNLVVVGYRDEDAYQGWAARISPLADVLWSRVYEDFKPGSVGTTVSSVTVTDDGRAYVVGVSEMDVPGTFAFQGKTWVAELGL